jgi:hypothetical protein
MSVKSVLWVVGALAVTLCTAVPPATAEPAFQCHRAQGGRSGVVGHITDVRVGQHTTFDRFVVQFRENHVPRYDITRRNNTRFTTDPRGNTVTLRGSAGIQMVLPHATGVGSYSGPRDFRPPFVQLREARQLGDVESVTTWGLGLRHQSCLRAFTLASPARLVVDVPH